MPLAADLESARREFAATGPAELRDNGARVALLSTLFSAVRSNSAKPLLHLWSEIHNLTRRPLAGGKLAPRAVCHPAPVVVCIFIATTFGPLAGYNRHAAGKVTPREFFGEDTPAGPRRSD
jgi:hypothetical protein